MLESLKTIHSIGYVHRDIKPDNFLIDCQDPYKIYMIDFGLVKKYIHENKHIEFKSGKKLCGTPR